jgi:hypothetical protein
VGKTALAVYWGHTCEALGLVEELGDVLAAARTQLNLGTVWARRGDFARAARHSMLALRRYESTGHGTGGLVCALNNVGWQR